MRVLPRLPTHRNSPIPSLPTHFPPRQVRHLATDAGSAALYELVNIFATKDLEAFNTFVAGHAAFVASVGLDADASRRTMRMLTLCSMASTKSVLTYEAIAAALQVRLGGWGGGTSCPCAREMCAGCEGE